MRRFFTLSIVVLLFSCSTQYDQKLDNSFKGEWEVSSVTYSQDKIKVKAFSFQDAQCFVNSVWNFVPNNHTGKLKGIAKGDCQAVESKFTWMVSSGNQMTVKFVAEGLKAKDVTSGYLFQVQNKTDSSFDLVQASSLDGKPIYITYHFSKF